MKTLLKFRSTATLLVLIFCFCQSCSELPEADLVKPENSELFMNEPGILSIAPNIDNRRLNVAILVKKCGRQRTDQPVNLYPVKPKSDQLDVYNTIDYQIRWYDEAGQLISAMPVLECMGTGYYRVEVYDTNSGASGSDEVNL